MLQFVRIVLFASVFTAFAQGRELVPPDGPGPLAATVPIPSGVEANAVQEAILFAGHARGWMLKTKTDGEVVLFLEHGGWRSTLTLAYDASAIRIFSNSAKLDRKGRPKKYAIPERWVNYLKLDLTHRLGQVASGL